MLIKIPVSTGELADKITILEIKKIKIKDKLKLTDIKKEHKYLKLWDIEDAKRKAERNKNFGKSFISLARKVYIFNDKRAQIKSNINKITNSEIVEVKSYDKY